jgi:sigma54-dependent transcription regulator
VSADNGERKSARELRQALARNRAQIAADVSAMENRVQESLNPLSIASRHPFLMAGAGAALGVLIVRRPAMFVRALRQLAGWGAPVLLSALVRSHSPAPERSPAD